MPCSKNPWRFAGALDGATQPNFRLPPDPSDSRQQIAGSVAFAFGSRVGFEAAVRKPIYSLAFRHNRYKRSVARCGTLFGSVLMSFLGL